MIGTTQITCTSMRFQSLQLRQFQRKWLRRRTILLTLLISGAAVGIGLNGIAWMQARAMTHYVEAGERTAKPEKLSWSEKIGVVLTGVRLPRPMNRQTPDQIGLSYETHLIPISEPETQPATLEAWFIPTESPQKRGTVLLFPPYGASKQALFGPSKILHELGYNTMLVDFRGVGGSSGSDTTMGVREGRDVAQAMAYVQQHIQPPQPILLYGASMGAAAVMRAIAYEGVKPAAVILESPFDRLLHTVRHRFTAMNLPASPGSELIVWWGGFQQGIDGFKHNPVEYAKAIRCPVLLMYGTYDQRVTLAETESILDHIPSRKQLVVFPAVGHGSLANDDPLKWRQRVEAFLK
jgi:uncharacterized protein